MKKKIALVLTAVMLIGTMGACKKKDDGNNSSATNTPKPTVASTATDAPAPQDNTPAEDNTEDTATPEPAVVDETPSWPQFAFWDENFPGADLGGVTLKVTNMTNPDDEETPEAEREMWAERRDYVEAKFNVKLQFDAVKGLDWNETPDLVVASYAAGDPIVNLWDAGIGYWTPRAASGNALIDIGDYVRANFPESYYATSATYKGVVYGFSPSPVASWSILVYNRDLIKAAGMEQTPTEMFLSGHWNLDEFYAYMSELASKLPDGVGAIGAHITNWQRGAAYANGGFFKDPKTSVPGYLDEAFLEPLRLYQKMVSEKIALQPVLNPDSGHYSFGTLAYDPNALFRAGELAMTYAAEWDLGDHGAAVDYGIVPWPWGSNVTIDNGDYKTLKNHGYSSYATDAGSMVMVKGTEKLISVEQAVNLFFSYRQEEGDTLVTNKKLAAEGKPVIRGDSGTLRNFTTQEDADLFDWYRMDPLWEGLDQISGDTDDLYYCYFDAVATGSDLRAAFQGVIGQDIWRSFEDGFIKLEDVPADLKAQAEEWGLSHPAEDGE